MLESIGPNDLREIDEDCDDFEMTWRSGLEEWQTTTNLASDRNESIDKLPETERQPWRQFWTRAAELHEKLKTK